MQTRYSSGRTPFPPDRATPADLFDPAGNQLGTPDISSIAWDWQDQIGSISYPDPDDASATISEYYVYAPGGGQRVRKVRETVNSKGLVTRLAITDYLGNTERRAEYVQANPGLSIEFDGETISNAVAQKDYSELRIRLDHAQSARLLIGKLSAEGSQDESRSYFDLSNQIDSVQMELDESGAIQPNIILAYMTVRTRHVGVRLGDQLGRMMRSRARYFFRDYDRSHINFVGFSKLKLSRNWELLEGLQKIYGGAVVMQKGQFPTAINYPVQMRKFADRQRLMIHDSGVQYYDLNSYQHALNTRLTYYYLKYCTLDYFLPKYTKIGNLINLFLGSAHCYEYYRHWTQREKDRFGPFDNIERLLRIRIEDIYEAAPGRHLIVGIHLRHIMGNLALVRRVLRKGFNDIDLRKHVSPNDMLLDRQLVHTSSMRRTDPSIPGTRDLTADRVGVLIEEQSLLAVLNNRKVLRDFSVAGPYCLREKPNIRFYRVTFNLFSPHAEVTTESEDPYDRYLSDNNNNDDDRDDPNRNNNNPSNTGQKEFKG